MFGRKKKKMAETIERLTRELESSKNEKESMRGEIDAMRDTLDHALESFKKSGTSSANATTTTITSMDADDLTRSLMVRETEFLSVIKNMTGLFETASADNRAVSENVKVLTDAYLKMNETVVSLATEVQKLQLKIDTLTILEYNTISNIQCSITNINDTRCAINRTVSESKITDIKLSLTVNGYITTIISYNLT